MIPEDPAITTDVPVQIVLPAHNEGESIGQTLRELHAVIGGITGIAVSFVVCEDGSRDNTVDVILATGKEVPLQLISSPERKGYSRAVIDGLAATSAPLVGFVDADGQCDPADFDRLYQKLRETNAELVVGFRNPRRDTVVRKVMSRSFGLVYKALFPVRLRDPSSPFLLIRRDALERVLAGRMGILKQGFWWEFYARAQAAGIKVAEVPVTHRVRTAGVTQVYRWSKIPRIATEHLAGLWELRSELRASKSR